MKVHRRMILSALVLLLAGCLPAEREPGDKAATSADSSIVGAGDSVVVTAADSSRALVLSVGQRLVVLLSANPTTGFAWALPDSTPGALAFEGPATYMPDPGTAGRVGTGGLETWRFRAAQAGDQRILLHYRRSFEPGKLPAQVVSFRVRVQ